MGNPPASSSKLETSLLLPIQHSRTVSLSLESLISAMDYSNYAPHASQPYSTLYGLPTPDQPPQAPSEDVLHDPFALVRTHRSDCQWGVLEIFLTSGFRMALTISIIRGSTPLSALTPPRPSVRRPIRPRTRSRSTRYRAMMCIIAPNQSLHPSTGMIANIVIRPGAVAARKRTRRCQRKVSARLKIGQRM
jgi:hypothetical protein